MSAQGGLLLWLSVMIARAGSRYGWLTSQQAVLCAPLVAVGGISAAQRARADLQRGWKGHPAGMLARDGTEPGMVGRRSRPRERALGAACSNPCV